MSRGNLAGGYTPQIAVTKLVIMQHDFAFDADSIDLAL